jgi:hyperosmotically inducible protein
MIVAGLAALGALALAACGQSETERMGSAPTPPGIGAGAKQATGAGPGQPPGQTAVQAITDTAITAKVKSAFLADEQLKGAEIAVNTSDGKVTLSGQAPSPAVRERAVQIARGVDGVKDVQDNISTN